MKKWAATTSMILVLLSTGIAHSQSMMSGQNSPGGVRVAPRRPGATQPSGFAQPPGFARRQNFVNHPGFVNRPGFVRHPGFARSSGFSRAARFPFWPGFVTNRVYFVRGGVLAPWPYWYNSPPPSYAPSQYWAYCQNPEGYYPYVQECPGGWVPVVPTPPAPEGWQSAPDNYQPPMDGGTSSDDIREQLERSRAESNGLDISLETTPGSRLSP